MGRWLRCDLLLHPAAQQSAGCARLCKSACGEYPGYLQWEDAARRQALTLQ
nr:hypothetical protein [Nostoc linckia]